MSADAAAPRRRRAVRPPPPPKSRWRGVLWAMAQVVLLSAECFLLLFLVAQPAFAPRSVEVVGVEHVTPAQVRDALDLARERSIFLVNHATLEARVRALPWVRSASVSLALPDRVRVTVTEWTPAAVMTQGEQSYYLNEQGIVLDPAAEAGPLPVIDPQGLGPVRSGSAAVDPDLLRMLVALDRGFQPAFHVRVLSFSLDPQQVLSLRTDRGYSIIFGQMATADQRASLDAKLGALRSLATRVDLTATPLVYVNLMNPRAPAILTRAR